MSILLQPAQQADLPAIVALMNAAFRGAQGQQGWSVESGYITGSRTTEPLLREEIAQGAHLLFTRDKETSVIHGCVSLKASSPSVWYLGSLTVDPGLQNSGFGRQLLTAAEEFAATHDAHTIEMTVISLRETLIAWYQRRGYRLTGEVRPFPYGDNRFGTPTRGDLEFVVLEKDLHEQPGLGSRKTIAAETSI